VLTSAPALVFPFSLLLFLFVFLPSIQKLSPFSVRWSERDERGVGLFMPSFMRFIVRRIPLNTSPVISDGSRSMHS